MWHGIKVKLQAFSDINVEEEVATLISLKACNLTLRKRRWA
jgi:hypothetical protein